MQVQAVDGAVLRLVGARQLRRIALISGVGLMLGACATQPQSSSSSRQIATVDPRLGVTASPRVVEDGRPIPRGGGTYRVGRPYTVAGRRYVPYAKREGHTETGVASWYGRQFHGRLTANGEVYNMHELSAAHRTMPMPSYARVTNLRNGHSIVVRVNDRGPFHANRVIDISSKASHLLDFRGHGLARVRVDYLGRAPMDGSDDRMLHATLRTNGAPAPLPGDSPGVMVASASPAFVPDTGRSSAAAPDPVRAGAAPVPPERPFDLGLANRNERLVTTVQTAAVTPSVVQAPAPVVPVTTVVRSAPIAAAPAQTAAAPVPPTRPASTVVAVPGRGLVGPSAVSAFTETARPAASTSAAVAAMPAPSRASFANGGLY
ncbi:MAG: septal ring lytic transglycosylase RlpA family protein [Alphaproteobacteria bacterium]